MNIWQLQEAKAKLAQLIKDSKKEPQIISRHGVNESVVMSFEKYQELLGQEKNLVSFIQASPLYGLDLELKRDTQTIREIKL